MLADDGTASSRYLPSSSASENGKSGSPLRVGWKCSPRRPSRASIAMRAERCAGKAASTAGSSASSTCLISVRVPASSSRDGSNAARRTLPCVSAVATRYGVEKRASAAVAGSAIPATSSVAR